LWTQGKEFGIKGLGFGDLGYKDPGLINRVNDEGSEFWMGFRVWVYKSGFRVQGMKLRVEGFVFSA
jgi:hypothetical protein